MAKNNSSQAPKTRPKFWEAISVKFIIIFWFTLLMVIVSALVMVFMLTVSRLTMEQDMQRRVLSGVKANSNDLKCENDTIQAKGGFQYYVNGVYCLIYDANCNKVAGEYPEGFYTNAGFEDGDWIVVRKQTDANEGDIVVALFEGLNNLKYFYWNKKKNCAVLRSANKAKGYKDIEVYDLQIQGVAQNVIKGL